MSDPSRQQTAATLDLPADADAAAVRAAFLQQLAATDFVPPEAVMAAVNRLARGRLPLSMESRQEAARYENADLEKFVEKFWQLAPAERTRTWERLDLHCADESVRETLARLKLGLSVAVVRHEDWAADKMASFIRDNFLLPPRERAVRRMEWLAEQSFGPVLAARAKWLRDRDAGTAGLDPVLIQDMLLPQAEPLEVPPLPQTALDKIAAKEARKAEKAERQAVRQTTDSGEGGWKFSWHWLWLVAIVARLAAGIGGGSGNNTTPTYRPQYTPQSDIFQPRTQPDAARQAGQLLKDFGSNFTEQQIREFQAFVPGSGKAAPPGWSTWVLLGRPSTPLPPPPGKR